MEREGAAELEGRLAAERASTAEAAAEAAELQANLALVRAREEEEEQATPRQMDVLKRRCFHH